MLRCAPCRRLDQYFEASTSVFPRSGKLFPFLHVLGLVRVKKPHAKCLQDGFGTLLRFHRWFAPVLRYQLWHRANRGVLPRCDIGVPDGGSSRQNNVQGALQGQN